MPTPPDFRIVDQPLPYVDRLGERSLADIELVVIHCTELPDLATAREYGERLRYDSGTGNSGHYYIDRDGTVLRYVPEQRIAHHVRGQNPRSLGIELVNTGRFPHWLDSRHQAMDEAYTDAQIGSLVALLQDLAKRLPSLQHIAGHEDLDRERVPASDDPAVLVHRKLDPGPRFPWERVLAQVPLQRLL
ncbi:N-acetylmuramoyl-L-alanine amidase [Pseudoxanthomonas suwonensis]|uniref:N-acetylmuramoyl-L-alanine amidase n=1 Tax=Pseudoxanthomonas suwonensis TaxID=314722 RepID=UPI0004660A91|nr:N-acetylmuramoyl-L-alanine amidase [Pseudoxanthomonas suwonensis]